MQETVESDIDVVSGGDRTISFEDNRLLVDLCGEFDRNLSQIEERLGLAIVRRGNALTLHGNEDAVQLAAETLAAMYERLEQGREVTSGDIDAALHFGSHEAKDAETGESDQIEMFGSGKIEIRTRKKVIEPRSPTQAAYLKALYERQLVFGIGPAGTGKTYLAVAAAVSMYIDGRVDKIILSRPAVEAGERLGFLPGDMKDKVDPYMQPLYDALNDFLPGKQVARLIEDKQIEIAPLAFMRGRTLADAFVVLDEAQNATEMQMKMFLTRLGEGSRMAVTGDVSQIDLPRGVPSGLVQATRLLKDVEDIGHVTFTASDVVRHPLVAKIIRAYDAE